jgi:hypothetical protein
MVKRALTRGANRSEVLYVTRWWGDAEEAHLIVRDVAGREDHVLLTYDAPLGSRRGVGLGLDWARRDLVHVSADPVAIRGLLIQLGK